MSELITSKLQATWEYFSGCCRNAPAPPSLLEV